jgi:hypothetical protein
MSGTCATGETGTSRPSRVSRVTCSASLLTSCYIPFTPHPLPLTSSLPLFTLSPLLFTIFVLAFGCSAENSQPAGRAGGQRQPALTAAGGNQPPVVRSVRIFPNPVPVRGAALAQADGDDPDGDPVTFRYQWLANGLALTGETAATLAPARLKRGDSLTVEVVPSDGKTEGAPLRADPAAIGNSPPEVTRIVLPSAAKPGDLVEAQVEAEDADGDPVAYQYRWWRNKTVVQEGDRNALETAGFSRGDTVVVEVTPRDATDSGKPLRSLPLALANAPPSITSTPPSSITPGRFQYAVTATDPEGDPLTYAMTGAPPGMTIDPASGRIDWQIPPQAKGTFPLHVTVEDGRGGRAFQDFEIRLP